MDSINRRQFLAGTLATALAPAALESAPVPRAPGMAPSFPPRFEEPPMPAGVYQRLGSARFRIPEQNSELWLTPNGKYVVTGPPNEIKVWEFTTGRCVATHSLSNHFIQTVSDRYSICLKCEFAKWTVRWVDLLSGRIVKTIEIESEGHAHRAAIDPTGRLMLITSPNEVVQCFDFDSGQYIWANECKNAGEKPFVFSGDGSRVAIVFDGKVAIVDTRNGFHINGFQIRTHDRADSVVLSHTGKMIVDWSSDGTGLRVHEVATAKCIWKGDFEGGIRAVQVLPDDLALLIAVGKNLILCDLKTGKELQRCSIRSTKIVVSRDAKFAVVENVDSALEFLDLRTGARLPQTTEPAGGVGLVVFLSNQHFVGRFGAFQTVWDLARRSARNVDSPDAHSSSIAIAPDGVQHAAVVPSGVQIFDPTKSGKAQEIALSDIREVGWLDPQTLIAWTDEKFDLHDLATGSSKSFKGEERERPWDIRASGDGKTVLFRWIVFVGINNGAYGGTKLTRLDRATGRITPLNLGYLPDWRHFSSTVDLRFISATEFLAYTEWVVSIRSGLTGATIRTITEIVSESPSAVSPDGRMVAVVRKILMPERLPSDDEDEDDEDERLANRIFTEEVQLIEFRTWTIRRRFPAMSTPKSFALSPDGRTLATTHEEAPVYLWDLYGERTDLLPKPDASEWVELASTDAEVAFRAICQLVQHPAEALPMLSANLKPATVPDPKRVRKAIEELADRDYRTREAAQRELAGIVDRVRPHLQAAFDAGTHGPEANQRLEQLLYRTSPATPGIIRAIRAHEILERIGTPAAKVIVEASSKGAPDAEQSKDAAATLGRWEFNNRSA